MDNCPTGEIPIPLRTSSLIRILMIKLTGSNKVFCLMQGQWFNRKDERGILRKSKYISNMDNDAQIRNFHTVDLIVKRPLESDGSYFGGKNMAEGKGYCWFFESKGCVPCRAKMAGEDSPDDMGYDGCDDVPERVCGYLRLEKLAYLQ